MPDKPTAPKDEKRFEGIMPDAIYDDNVKKSDSRGRPDNFDTLQKLSKRHFPFSIRLIALIVGIILLCWALFIAFFQLIISALAALFFFKSSELNQMMRNLWTTLCRISAFTLSLLVAVFSPGFGIGILSLYLMMHGEDLEHSFIGRVIKVPK